MIEGKRRIKKKYRRRIMLIVYNMQGEAVLALRFLRRTFPLTGPNPAIQMATLTAQALKWPVTQQRSSSKS